MATLPKLLLATALVQLFVASPATAEDADASFAKSEAILGTRSQLAAILSEQGAPVRTTVLQPARYIATPRAIVESAALPIRTRLISTGGYTSRPDIFGTVALGLKWTPFTSRWDRVERARVGGAASQFASSLRHLDGIDRVRAVNRYVNQRVQFMDDERHYGRADVWSTADSTLRSGRGDCEDYAIAKIQMLRAAGLSDRDLYLVVLKDLVRRADHAVAVVRFGGQTYALDSGTDEVIDTESITDYRPILTLSANGAWTHGYRLRAPQLASLDMTSAGAVSSAAMVAQRSRSASLLALNTGLSR